MKLRRIFAWYYKCRRAVKDWLFFLSSDTWEVEHHGEDYKLYENGELEFEGRLEDLPWRIRAKWASRLASLDDLDDQCENLHQRMKERRSSTK
jgi:hypothetical protein